MAKRRAVLVGIDHYDRLDVPDLRGCVNDIARMRDMLKTFYGFTNSEIRALVEDRATRDAIIERLRWLVADPEEGDILVFHYSGHGTRIRERNEQGLLDDEEDGLEEAICPYDMDWDGGYIRDDDLRAIFAGVPEWVIMEVFLDTCFSGTGTRVLDFGLPPAERMFDSGVRFVAPPIDVAGRTQGDEGLVRNVPLVSALRDTELTELVFWAATKEDGTANEGFFNGRYNGVFTYMLTSYVRDVGGRATRAEILAAVSEQLRANGYRQEPDLDCAEALRVEEPVGGERVLPVWSPFDL